MLQYIIILLVCFVASMIGSICGIGGGVIVKPVLDSMGIMSVETLSYLSGVMVLSMSAYSIGKAVCVNEIQIKDRVGILLAVGAAVGGLLGKQIFDVIQRMSTTQNKIGAYQAIILFVLTFGTLLYTAKKKKIKTLQVKNKIICIFIGLSLGLLSSFLGIGGGPFNLVVLSFFFSMETKVAIQNSLLIILISQIFALLNTIATNRIPEFSWTLLVGMVVVAVVGAAMGRVFNQKLTNEKLDKLFCSVLVVILIVCAYNFFKYMI